MQTSQEPLQVPLTESGGTMRIKRRTAPEVTLAVGCFAALPLEAAVRIEGRVPVGGSEFTSKDAALQGGSSRNRCRLNVKMCTSLSGPREVPLLVPPKYQILSSVGR